MRMKVEVEWEDPREGVDAIVHGVVEGSGKEVEPSVAPQKVRVEPGSLPLIIIGPGGDFVRRLFDPDSRPAGSGLDVQC